MATWIPSPNFYHGRKAPLLWIVWHSTESPEVSGGARNVAAGWFAKSSSKVSAHVVVDNANVIECVKPGDTAWHAASANASGYGIEIVGKAAQSAVDWSDPYSLAAIRNACTWITSTPELLKIPHRWLSDNQLRNRESGFITHAQVSRVMGGTTHTDPGTGFPFAYVMEQMGTQGTAHDAPVAARTTLRPGYSGQSVAALQAGLNRAFPSYAHLVVDGDYGLATTAVVQEFQRRTGLTADGIVGPMTWAKLAEYGI